MARQREPAGFDFVNNQTFSDAAGLIRRIKVAAALSAKMLG
jgi:hypothetical protein